MVGNNNSRRAKIAAVDLDYSPRPPQMVQEPGPLIHDDRQWRHHLRRERSSAYWFAATKWGMLGLILGMLIGGTGMYVASVATLPMAQEALFKGAAMHDARDKALNDPSAPPRLTPPSESTP